MIIELGFTFVWKLPHHGLVGHCCLPLGRRSVIRVVHTGTLYIWTHILYACHILSITSKLIRSSIPVSLNHNLYFNKTLGCFPYTGISKEGFGQLSTHTVFLLGNWHDWTQWSLKALCIHEILCLTNTEFIKSYYLPSLNNGKLGEI